MQKSVKMLPLVSCLLVLLSATSLAQNQNISGGFIYEGEPYLAINPADAQHMVVAWMGLVAGSPVSLKSKTTFDGGERWSETLLLPHFGENWQSADPSIGFDTDGNVFFCYVDYLNDTETKGAVYVVKSEDGGLSIAASYIVLDANADGEKYPVDRPWMVIDHSLGSSQGNLYITTKPAPWVKAPNRPYFVKSTDGGKSWSSWKYIDAPNFEVGPFVAGPMATPTVTSNGTLHIIYVSFKLSQNLKPGFIVASSSDGGESFSYHPVFYGESSSDESRAKVGYLVISDPSNPAHIGFLFVAAPHADLDIFFTESFDEGSSWTEALRINDDPVGNGVVQDLCWADFNESGDLIVTWRDRRNGEVLGFESASETWASWRATGESAFSANFNLSDKAANYLGVLSDTKGNDFMCTRLVKDTLISVWSDVRDNRLNIWFEKRSVAQNVTTSTINLTTMESNIRIFPNPANQMVQIEAKNFNWASLYDARGTKILKSYRRKIEVQHLGEGAYTLLVKDGLHTQVKKILILH